MSNPGEKIAQFDEALMNDSDLFQKFNDIMNRMETEPGNRDDKIIKAAKELGYDLSKADFVEEIDDDDLDDVAGGVSHFEGDSEDDNPGSFIMHALESCDDSPKKHHDFDVVTIKGKKVMKCRYCGVKYVLSKD
jgi:hypothetical protein